MEQERGADRAIVSDLSAFRRRKAGLARRVRSGVADVTRTVNQSSPSRAEARGDRPRELERHPRRESPATYTIAVDIVGAEPPIRRTIEIASDVGLDRLHNILQAAFGWDGAQPHAVTVGADAADRSVQAIVPDSWFGADGRDDAVAEHSVTLDELLAEVGDRLWYEYDFGDSWTHAVRLLSIGERAADEAPARLIGGLRRSPAEGSGGIGAYDWMVSSAGDPRRSDHRQAVEALRLVEREPGSDSFDDEAAATTAAVARAAREPLLRSNAAPALEGVYARLDHPGRISVAGAIVSAELSSRPPVSGGSILAAAELSAGELIATLDDAEVDVMTAPFSWYLSRVGRLGVALDASGRLPRAFVLSAAGHYGLDTRMLGRAAREHRAFPLLPFRDALRSLDLARSYRGRFELTRAGRSTLDDPRELLRRITSRVIPAGDGFAADASALYLLAVAADERAAEHAVLRRIRLRDEIERVERVERGSAAGATGAAGADADDPFAAGSFRVRLSLPRLVAGAGWHSARRSPVSDEQFRDATAVTAMVVRIVSRGGIVPPRLDDPIAGSPELIASAAARAQTFATIALRR